MNKEDIIRMAREAGIGPVYGYESIERFAALVAAAECEACAKAVEAEAHMFATLAAAKSLADAIRART